MGPHISPFLASLQRLGAGCAVLAPRSVLSARGGARGDLVLATLIVLVSGAVSWYGYLQVLAHTDPGAVLIDNIPAQYSTYAVTHGEICVARISTEIASGTQEDHRLNVYMRLRLRYREREREIRAHLQGDFNPLNQLVEGKLTLTTPEGEIEAAFHDVNPISISLPGSAARTALPSPLTIPGPLLLRPRNGGGYRLEYAAIRSGTLGASPSHDSPLRPIREMVEGAFSQLHVDPERREILHGEAEEPLPCNGRAEGWLDVSEGIANLLHLSARFYGGDAP